MICSKTRLLSGILVYILGFWLLFYYYSSPKHVHFFPRINSTASKSAGCGFRPCAAQGRGEKTSLRIATRKVKKLKTQGDHSALQISV